LRLRRDQLIGMAHRLLAQLHRHQSLLSSSVQHEENLGSRIHPRAIGGLRYRRQIRHFRFQSPEPTLTCHQQSPGASTPNTSRRKKLKF
jgi:hypothetical protein